MTALTNVSTCNAFDKNSLCRQSLLFWKNFTEPKWYLLTKQVRHVHMCIFMIHCSIIIINYMFTFLLLNSNVLHSYIFCTFLGLLYNVFTFRFTYAGWMGDVSGRWLVIFVPTNVNYLFFNDKNWSQFHTLKYTNLSLSFSTIYVNWLGYVHHVN